MSGGMRVGIGLAVMVAVLFMALFTVASCAAQPERVVVLTPQAAEVLRLLGAEDKIVGISSTVLGYGRDAFFPELAGMPQVGSFHHPDVERIIELEPDVVIEYTWAAQYLEESLTPLGIEVWRYDFYEPQTLLDEIEELASRLGSEYEGAAQEYVRFAEEKMEAIESVVSGIPEDERPKVFIEGGPYGQYYTTNNSGWAVCVEWAGGENVAADIVGEGGHAGAWLDPEWVVDQDPEVFVKVSWWHMPGGYGSDDPFALKEFKDEIAARSELETVSAVVNDGIYVITFDMLLSPSYFAGVAQLAKWFHPETATSLKPRQWHKEYLEKFHNLGYLGVHTYPLLFGDANIDDVVSIRDAQWIAKYDVGLLGDDEIDEVVADVSGDERVTITDAMLVAKFIVGLIEEFPVEA